MDLQDELLKGNEEEMDGCIDNDHLDAFLQERELPIFKII